jgi:hypothetical protein
MVEAVLRIQFHAKSRAYLVHVLSLVAYEGYDYHERHGDRAAKIHT